MNYAILERKRAAFLGQVTSVVTSMQAFDATVNSSHLITQWRESLQQTFRAHQTIIDNMLEHDDANEDKIAQDAERFRVAHCNAICALNDLSDSITNNASDLPMLQADYDATREQFSEFEIFTTEYREGNVSVCELKSRLADLMPLNMLFSSFWSKLKDKSNEERKVELATQRKLFIAGFYKVVGWFNQEISRRAPSPPSSGVNQFAPTAFSAVKLPPIELGKFDGTPETWVTFRDTFKTNIHSSTNLSGSLKFRYLKASITDKNSPINHLLETDEGYEDAWKAVIDFYDDKRRILDGHFHGMITAKRMTTESHEELQRLINDFNLHTSSIERMMTEQELYRSLVAHLVIHRLDPHTRDLWETENKSQIPKWPELQKFLTQRRKTLSTMPSVKAPPKPSTTVKPTNNSKSSWKTSNVHANNNSQSSQAAQSKPDRTSAVASPHTNPNTALCWMCNDAHRLSSCSLFLNLNAQQRHAKVNEWKLCSNCFGSHHIDSCQSTYRCRSCKQKHHTMLHQELQASAKPFQQANASCNSSFAARPDTITLFQTALVSVQDSGDGWHLMRAFLDSGSDSNFISLSAAKALKLPMEPTNVQTRGLGGNPSMVIKSLVTASISNDEKSEVHQMNFLVTPKVTNPMPSTLVDKCALGIPENLKLADPKFEIPGKIDMMLGNQIYGKLLRNGRVELAGGTILLNTMFGWIFTGSAPRVHPMISTSECFHNTLGELRESIEKFYKLEDYRNDKRFFTDEEEYCERFFEQTHRRLPTGRFEIRIPFKENVDQLTNNYRSSLSQFLATEKRLQKNEELRTQYIDFMREYEKLGHMTEIDLNDDPPGAVAFYLPHHPVFKPDSTTTKVRVVFNGSSKTSSGLSLNDTQCVGPQIQSDSFTLTLRFRKHAIVIKADIAKMYRQILVAPDQRKFQRIIWRESPLEKLRIMNMNTVTYGTASASHDSTRCIKQLGIDNMESEPEAAKEIIESFYVDDLMTGASTVPDAKKLFNAIDKIISSAEMDLRKVNSNHPEFLASIPETKRESSDENAVIKALGVKWNPKTDKISFDVKRISTDKCTRRVVLSEFSKIYDPQGLIGPVVFMFKQFMKKICQLSTTWDETLPEQLSIEWMEIASTFEELNRIQIPRCFLIASFVTAELHGFCDASDLGYGAAVYIRSSDSRKVTECHLVCAKSRVAPTEWRSTARLELCGAVILANLMIQVAKALMIPNTKMFCWTDSSICLHWMKKSPAQLQTFVANRVSEIQELSSDIVWRHIRTDLNPADQLSRGRSPIELIDNDLWWHGPPFLLRQAKDWPESIVTIDPSEPAYISEFKKIQLPPSSNDCQKLEASSHASSATNKNEFVQWIEGSSRTWAVKRRMSWIMRFAYNARSIKLQTKRRSGPIDVADMQDAEIALVRIFQKIHFSEDFRRLSSNPSKAVKPGSSIKNLNPIWDEKLKVITVGGRLNQAQHFGEQQKHPILLPKCHFTKLIIRETHQRNLHSGQLATLGIIRMKFWPIRAKEVVRQELHKCIQCFRARPKLVKQFMGNLPAVRISPSPTFFHTGVDYCGPFNIKVSTLRNAKSTVAYVALFICMATKAIHLEIVSKLSTEAFLAAFDKFVSRRGLPHSMYSDNGLNFVGANNSLKELHEFLGKSTTQADIRSYFQQQEIEWHFIPPRAPEHGGLWEAGVKSMKYHFHRVAESSFLTFEEFDQLKSKIEAVLNSRPLTALSDDPNDFSALTAGHFLIGRPLVAKPERDFTNVSVNRLQRWDRVVQIQQHFWQRWNQDYLHQLQVRTKNYKDKIPVSVGQLVLLHVDNCPSLHWPIGRIQAIYPGRDGVTRVASIKTAKSTYERPVTKLALLPIDPDDDQLSPAENVHSSCIK